MLPPWLPGPVQRSRFLWRELGHHSGLAKELPFRNDVHDWSTYVLAAATPIRTIVEAVIVPGVHLLPVTYDEVLIAFDIKVPQSRRRLRRRSKEVESGRDSETDVDQTTWSCVGRQQSLSLTINNELQDAMSRQDCRRSALVAMPAVVIRQCYHP